jgi:hypothetical protein
MRSVELEPQPTDENVKRMSSDANVKSSIYYILPGIVAVVLLVVALVLVVANVEDMFGLPVLSAGDFATGYLGAGKFSAGVFVAGIFSVGVFSIGIFSIGIFSIGIFNIGLFSVGMYALGIYTISMLTGPRKKREPSKSFPQQSNSI